MDSLYFDDQIGNEKKLWGLGFRLILRCENGNFYVSYAMRVSP